MLRRLSNVEYANTIRDLTGVNLDPAREFPQDGAAGEGFTNTGDALVMSPSLLTKYFDAAKGVAAHAVLLPDGFRFSRTATRRDWTDEIVADIRRLYDRHADKDGKLPLEAYLAATIELRSRSAAGPVKERRYPRPRRETRPEPQVSRHALGDAERARACGRPGRVGRRSPHAMADRQAR